MADSLHEFLTSLQPNLAGYLLLGIGALVEYVFPPFPGDVVVVTGAILAGAAGWSAVLVLVATLAGSLLGMALDQAFGSWVHQHDAAWRERHPLWARVGRGIDRLLPLYRKHPTLLLMLNRFMPSVRAFIFVAAGMEGTPRWKVLSLGGLSAAVWLLVLFLVGFLVGRDLDELLAWVQRWSLGAGIVLLLLLLWWLRRQFRAR